ncbi:hypothetical protein EDC94DRAFT_613426 [Helicostylum pulchrum]|nr:hypothetical protein EDC94DRAFT_613426 [Helicostylum pulchrum]
MITWFFSSILFLYHLLFSNFIHSSCSVYVSHTSMTVKNMQLNIIYQYIKQLHDRIFNNNEKCSERVINVYGVMI